MTDHEIKKTLIEEKNIHLDKSKIFYTDLKELTMESRQNNEIEVLSFDYEQIMPLPPIPRSDVFYKRQLWVFNFCIYSGKTGKAHFFMYDETVGKKSQNEVISFINYYLQNFLQQGIKKLYIFSDNCSSQNKNMVLVQYLYTIVQSNAFGLEIITHRYPEPGHSFLPCDRCFGIIEQKKRKIERVYVPETYRNMVKETCPNKFNVINVTQDYIWNFSECLKHNFKKYIFNKDKTIKFTLMAYRKMDYVKDGLHCSIIANSSGKEHFLLQKLNSDIKYPIENLSLLYQKKLDIKTAKLKDIQDLALKYVPQEYFWFYENLLSSQIEDNDDNESLSEYID